jgi:internalin A
MAMSTSSPSPDEQAILDDAGLVPAPEECGWGLRNLTDAQLPVVRRLPSLRALVLFETCDRGETTDAGLAYVAGHPTLQQLDLGPGITDAGLRHIEGLVSLCRLRLDSASGVTDAGMRHLESLSRLASLSLQYTHVGNQGLRSIAGLRSLTELEINNTDVTDDGLAHLASLTSLETLHLCGSQETNPDTMLPSRATITDNGLLHLATLSKLRRLRLDSTAGAEITANGLRGLAHLDLDSLRLRGPGIDDACIELLTGFAHLKSLSLTNTRLSKAGMARLKWAMRACRIDIVNVADIDLGRFGFFPGN